MASRIKGDKEKGDSVKGDSDGIILGVNGCDGVKDDEESPDGAATSAAIGLGIEDHFQMAPCAIVANLLAAMSGHRWECTLCQNGSLINGTH